MKRQALDHTKMDLLMERLDLRRYEAVGILESLWHLTAREAPQGNIGKLSDERIAIGIDWRGASNKSRSGEAVRLIQALVEAQWLDVDAEWRLVVHDWHEHADEAVKKYIKRNGLTWAVSRHVETNRNTSRLPVPAPVPVPEDQHQNGTPPQPAARVRVLPTPQNSRFREWLDGYRGRKADPDGALRAWISVDADQHAEEAFACRDRYNASAEVERGAVMEAGKFIFQQGGNGWSGNWPRARDSPGSRRLTPTEVALQRAREEERNAVRTQ